MSEMGLWLRFVLAVLATWRITHLLAREDGPADLIVRLRARLGDGFAGELMDCFYCLSLWVAAPFALVVSRDPLLLLLTWPALSGAACLLERIGQDPVVIEPLSTHTKDEANHGMLWSEKSATQEHAAENNAGVPATRTA